MFDRSLEMTAIAGVLALLAWSPAQAQMNGEDAVGTWTVEGRGGVGLPMADLSDVADLGPAFGAGVAYRVHPRVRVRADGDLEFFSGADVAAGGTPVPDVTAWHFSGGAEVDVLPPARRLGLSVHVGGGATVYDTEAFAEPVFNPLTDDPEADFNATYATVTGGLNVSYPVTRRVDAFVGGQVYYSFADEEDTAIFSAFTPAVSEQGFDKAWSIPLRAGIRASF